MKRVLGIVLRVVGIGIALGVSALVIYNAFDGLDGRSVLRAIRGLSDAAVIALASAWVVWLACQGLQTASLIADLPVRRGVIAFLGPAAIASLIPGPSDLPVRHKMVRSWGYSSTAATVAVAAGGLFTIGIKLLLPLIATIGLILSDSPLDGRLRTIVVVVVIVSLGAGIVAFVLGSQRRTAAVGDAIDPLWRAALRTIRRRNAPEQRLGERFVVARADAAEVVRGRWPMATWATVLTSTTRFTLLVMAVRFAGIGEELISWPQLFVVYALLQGLTIVPLTAGDAGVSELALIGMITAVTGADTINEVTAGVLIFRLLTWLALIPAGIAALGVWRVTSRGVAAAVGEPDEADEMVGLGEVVD